MRHTLAWLLPVLLVSRLLGQPANPVYVDDSPRATDVLGQVSGLVERGNNAEAVRALQSLLETEGRRLVADPDDPQMYRSVRSRVNDALLESDDLLARYRLSAGPLAARLLSEGRAERVEREFLLTEAGFDAAVMRAETRFESADFDAAYRLLVQLDRHPDRAGARARRAAQLLAEIARYRGESADLEIARRWSPEVPGELEVIDAPPAALKRGYAAFEQGPALADPDPLAQPLRSSSFGSADPDPVLLTDGERPWILPTVAGDALLINDGERVQCFDTATLEPRWTFNPGVQADPRMRGRRTRGRNQPVEDTMTVTAGGGVAVAALGETFGRRRWGDGRLHAIEIDTGDRLWSIGPGGIDEELSGAMFHGPVVISGDTLVAGLFTFAPLRRVHLCHLVGLDLYTGETKWVQLVGTAGVMPSQRGVDSSPVMRVQNGLVYRISPLGVITAVEASTGRVAWSRLVPSASEAQGSEFRAWMQNAPIIDEQGRLIAIEPDQSRVVVLDAESGARLGERLILEFGWPDYFSRIGDRLVFVGDHSFRVTSVAGVLTDTPTEIRRLDHFRTGRAVVAGDVLVEPTQQGVQLIDPIAGSATHAKLEFAGAPAVADGQLLIVGTTQVHGYLDWTSAQRVLQRRIETQPDNPAPAIALAELAFRAGDMSQIAPAALSALDAVDRGGNAEARHRLYGSLLSMLESTSLPTAKIRGGLVEVLDRAAVTANQRVGVAMQRGLWQREAGRAREAAAAFQSILDSDELADAQYQTRWRLERADRAATAALAALVEAEGARAYRRFASAAAEALSTLRESADSSGTQFEALARRYPVAPATPEIWLEAAATFEAAGQLRLAQSALRDGFDAALRIDATEEPGAQEIAGRLAAALADADKLYAALQVVRSAPGMTRDGQPIEAEVLEGELLARLGARTRAPRVGPVPTAMAQLLGGWEPIEPLSSRGAKATSHVLMQSERQGVIALWSVGGEPGPSVQIDWASTVLAAPDAPTGLVPVWTRPLGLDAASAPVVLSLSPTAAILYYGTYDSARLECIDTVTGQTRWASPVFASFFEGRPDRYDKGVLETPLDGQVWLRDHLIVASRDHIGIIERFGRAVVFERSSGAAVMAAQLDVPMVYEAALEGGVLAVVGERPGDPAKNEGDGVVPMAAAWDIRTGSPLFGPAEFRERRSFGRWVRLAGDQTMLLGLDLGVVGINLTRGETAWTVDDPAVRLSGDCIVTEGRAYILGVDRQLWQIDLTTGRLRSEPLEDLGRVSQADVMTASPLPGGGLAVASDIGLAVFNESGQLIGGDAYDGSIPFRTPAVAEGLVAAIAARPDPSADDDDAPRSYRYAALRLPDGTIQAERSLELHGAPRSITALDEFFVIGLNNATAVYSAPTTESNSP